MPPTVPKDVEMEDASQNPPSNFGLDFFKMNPYPKRMFLQKFSVPELIRWSFISSDFHNWIRAYLAEFRVLTIKPYNNKMCLSREPCSIPNFTCTHRVIRSVSTLKKLVEMDMLNVDTICIQSPSKPKNIRGSLHMTKKTCSFFKKGIKRVIIDVCEEKNYVDSMFKLLSENNDTLELFMVRNLNVDESKFNFPRFLNRTQWGVENFPMRKGYMKNKKQRYKDKKAGVPAQVEGLQNQARDIIGDFEMLIAENPQ